MLLTNLKSTTTAWLLAILLIITFSLGALLTLTMQERNRIKEALKETKQELKVEKSNTAGCLTQVYQLNQGIAEQALKAAETNKYGEAAATATLAKLPALIRKDQASPASPVVATNWVKDLFQ